LYYLTCFSCQKRQETSGQCRLMADEFEPGLKLMFNNSRG
jgi:hypothetical protein